MCSNFWLLWIFRTDRFFRRISKEAAQTDWIVGADVQKISLFFYILWAGIIQQDNKSSL